MSFALLGLSAGPLYADGNITNFSNHTIDKTVQELRITPSKVKEYTSLSIDLLQQDTSCNAMITLSEDSAIATARSLATSPDTSLPLFGVPIAVKDNIHVAGIANTAGTEALRNFVPTEDASAIKRLREAGAIILGKSNLHELAFGITSDNAVFGAVCNAVDSRYFAGGSSGGSAVVVAQGKVVAALGTDTGGSSRIPAALNGITGFRPTTGRYPSDGITRISNTRDTIGPMAKYVSDIIVLDQVMSGKKDKIKPAKLEGLRIGVPEEYFFADLEPIVAHKIEHLLKRLKAAGVILVRANIPNIAEVNSKVSFPVVLYETGQLIPEYIKRYAPDETFASFIAQIKSPDVKGVMGSIAGGAIPQDVYQEALNTHRPQLQKLYQEYFNRHQVEAIIFPTTPLTAGPIQGSGETIELNGKQVPTFPTFIRNTDPSSNAGIPGISLPLQKGVAELPVGVELDGPAESDARLLAIALAVEELIHNKK